MSLEKAAQRSHMQREFFRRLLVARTEAEKWRIVREFVEPPPLPKSKAEDERIVESVRSNVFGLTPFGCRLVDIYPAVIDRVGVTEEGVEMLGRFIGSRNVVMAGDEFYPLSEHEAANRVFKEAFGRQFDSPGKFDRWWRQYRLSACPCPSEKPCPPEKLHPVENDEESTETKDEDGGESPES